MRHETRWRTALRTSRELASAAGGTLALVFLAPTTAWADLLTPQSGGSPNAGEIDSLYKLVLYLALAVFIGVEGMLVYSLVAYRARRGRVPAQIRGNTRLEIGWTIAAGPPGRVRCATVSGFRSLRSRRHSLRFGSSARCRRVAGARLGPA
jgi:cytochrome c oxidase subunit II-like protein